MQVKKHSDTAYLRNMRLTRSVLFIQTAFIGDTILATSMVESWHKEYPNDEIDFCARRGNEDLFINHPFIRELLVWDKRGGFWKRSLRLLTLARSIRKKNYDIIVTPHRHASSGVLAGFSGAPVRSGYSNHPFSWRWTHRIVHEIGNDVHETARNHKLIQPWMTDAAPALPRLYPRAISDGSNGSGDFETDRFVVLAPASQWFTKQWPRSHWIELINRLAAEKKEVSLVLVGGKGDRPLLEEIKGETNHPQLLIETDLSLMQTAALMKRAWAVVSNDSGPLHLASAVNAPIVALFCSTTPAFGFGPLSEISEVVEADEMPSCKPCGLHGHRKCPAPGEHFLCGKGLSVNKVWNALDRISTRKREQ